MNPGFYAREVVEVSRDLVGCVLRHEGCAGLIVETEAYHFTEEACHAYVGRTPRTRVLFGPPGRAYVYRSYGIHALLNAVAEPEGVGAAALIRALEPLEGLQSMMERRGTDRVENLCAGPGRLTQALGIELGLNDTPIGVGPVVIEPGPQPVAARDIVAGRRIGVTRAVDLPWRFCLGGSRFVSRPWPPGLRPPKR